MRPCVQIFKNELLNCIDDCIDIMESDFKNDMNGVKLVGELKLAKTIIVPLGEHGIVEILDVFIKCVSPLKNRIAARDKKFFEKIEMCKHCLDERSTEICICLHHCEEECRCNDNCINCSDIITTMDSKTFKAIKTIMKKGKDDDVHIMFEYIDSFVAAGEKYRLETKEKLS